MSLLLNAIFHHSLLFIPQQEIPGVVPSAFVMRHPENGEIEVIYKLFYYNSLLFTLINYLLIDIIIGLVVTMSKS